MVGGAGTFLYLKIVNAPTKQTEYADLRLGMTMGEAKYAKGYPSDVLGSDRNELGDRMVIRTDQLKDNQRLEDFNSWQFDTPAWPSRIDLEFDPTTKLLVEIGCYSEGNMVCKPLLGLYD